MNNPFHKKVKDDLLIEEVQQENKAVALLKNKKVIIPVGVVLLLIILLILKSVLFGGSSLNYYDTLSSIFTNELGSFTYTIDVRTGEKGSLITQTTTTTVDDLNSIESAEGSTEESTEATAEETTETEDINSAFVDWDKYADTKTGNWKYPNYQITISGTTMSLDPLETDFTISIATENYNNVFTEVVCFDGNYYFDVESMYNWFTNSEDSYLQEIGATLPNGSKWLVIPESEFQLVSRYAEDGEIELSYVTSLKTLYERGLVVLSGVKSYVQSYVGETGMTSSDTTTSIKLSGTDATGFVNAIKKIAVNSGDFYTSVISTGYSNGLYDDTQYKQAVREKDNIIEALYDLGTYLQITDAEDLGLVVEGSARTFTNGYNNNQIEASLAFQYSTDTADHIIQFTGIRSGDTAEITLPEGSQSTENNSVFIESINNLVDYFNTTLIKTNVQLELTPDNMAKELLQSFADLVNETGSSEDYIRLTNVHDFIEEYATAIIGLTASENDYINVQLVNDLAVAINDIMGGVVVETEAVVEEEVEQYPTIEWSNSGVDYTFSYNADDSTASILVIDVEAINKSDADVTFNLTDFSARTLLNSIYPANNETLLLNEDNIFDMSLLTSETTLTAHEWGTYKLYIVLSNDDGHMDLYYGETNLGSVIEY